MVLPGHQNHRNEGEALSKLEEGGEEPVTEHERGLQCSRRDGLGTPAYIWQTQDGQEVGWDVCVSQDSLQTMSSFSYPVYPGGGPVIQLLLLVALLTAEAGGRFLEVSILSRHTAAEGRRSR